MASFDKLTKQFNKGNLGDNETKVFKKCIGVGILVIGSIITLPQTFYTLGSGEEAVVLRFGKHLNTITKAGLNFKVPFIDRVFKVNVKEVKRIEFGFDSETNTTLPSELLMLTGDENLASVETIVQYIISDSEDYLFNVDDQDGTLRVVAESEIRRCVANHTLDEVLTDNKFTIQQEIQEDLQKVLDKYESGIRITAVQLQDVNPPYEVEDAFKDVAGAKEDKTSFINQANSYKNEVVPQARGEASKILNDAEAYKEDRIKRAEGDVASFVQVLDKYQGGKEITRTRMYLETLQEILPGLDKYIVDESSGVLKFLPLGGGTSTVTTPNNTENGGTN